MDIYSVIRVGDEARCHLFVELPAAYGKQKSVYCRYADWCDRGVWPRLLAHLQADPDLSAMRRDSTAVRAPMSAAGTLKKKEAEPALIRSWGGFSAKIHILADRRGCPLRLQVTGGQRYDST